MTLIRQLRPALVIFGLLSLLTGILYPLGMTAVSSVLMPDKAAGSLIHDGERTVGSSLIGQNFTQTRYFHGRPSATTGADPADPTKIVPTPYNAAVSVGSNASPTSKALVERVAATLAQVRAENPEAIAAGWPIPMDLVTTSASGLDPDISPQAAFFQVKRIARVRHLTEERVRQLVEHMITHPLMGWLGEPHLNVLELNMALDSLHR
ncbi:potassium-transporting ATPase subunit KdpC [Gluconobacter sp. R75690]|uniref:potassium-transporting ATPase subunit KdpC n=1 Tax=unclassified Gluconobacter TaxID=2644261 RepID=UPI00188A3A96|nr:MULTISPECIES: potassium-transporting ATPase subunit KdpC [unclassified Gluconobacter]MBF0851687.1 potassium-transporting ATPase subunit KdpC [Gluconobacter sp. R75690]MBF0880749.1 potassium-transporting ATPase subunit KdpC [Gluconobacter sp. R75828]